MNNILEYARYCQKMQLVQEESDLFVLYLHGCITEEYYEEELCKIKTLLRGFDE